MWLRSVFHPYDKSHSSTIKQLDGHSTSCPAECSLSHTQEIRERRVCYHRSAAKPAKYMLLRHPQSSDALRTGCSTPRPSSPATARKLGADFRVRGLPFSFAQSGLCFQELCSFRVADARTSAARRRAWLHQEKGRPLRSCC